MPELPRVTMARFTETWQTLPVLLDRRGWAVDSHAVVTERADLEGLRLCKTDGRINRHGIVFGGIGCDGLFLR